jgi:hypothetical protein
MVGHLPATPCAPADAHRKQPYILPIGALRCRWEARSPFPAHENLQRGREAAAQAKLQKRLFLEAHVQPHSLPPPSAPADAHQKRPYSFPIGARQSHWVARLPFLAPEYLPVAAKPNRLQKPVKRAHTLGALRYCKPAELLGNSTSHCV